MGTGHGTHGTSGISSLFGGGACSREVHGVDDVEHEGERSRGVDAVRLNKSYVAQRKQERRRLFIVVVRTLQWGGGGVGELKVVKITGFTPQGSKHSKHARARE